MKKVLLIAFTLTLLVVSFSFTVLADSQSQIQACVAAITGTGFSGNLDSLCAVCSSPSISNTNGSGAFATCICKVAAAAGDLPPGVSNGQCIQSLHAIGIN